VQFERQFDLTSLAPKQERRSNAGMLRPSYLDQRQAG
jgi:hypothetical protein